MRHKIFIFWLLAAAATGCTRDEIPSSGYVSSSDAIGFSATSEDSTTKGEIITTANISEIDVYAYYTAQTEWSAANVSPMLFMQNQLVSRTDTDSSEEVVAWGNWLYSPTKYWPTSSSEKISFFAFAPYNEISVATDETSGKPIFSHTLSSFADENEDILAGVEYDVNNTAGDIEFSLTHALTKILLYARTEGENNDNYYADKFIVNGISIIGLYPTRTLEIDENGDCSWSLSEDNASQETIYIAANQGATLKSKDDYALGNYISGPDANYTEVTATDNAIFVHPQNLIGEGIQLQLRVRRIFTEAEGDDEEDDIYQTIVADLPTSVVEEWKVGEVIALYFSFDISNLSLYETPLTVTSEVFEWTDADVEVDIHSNIYIYSSNEDIAVEDDTTTDPVSYYGEFMICTNYDYTLRVPHYREELDGSITSSRGFLFCSDDFNSSSIDTYDVGNLTSNSVSDYKIFVPTLLDGKDGNELPYATKDDVTEHHDTATDTYTYTATVLCDDVSRVDTPIYLGSHEYAFIKNDETAENSSYRLLYKDGGNNNTLTAFDYSETTGDIDLDDFVTYEDENDVKGTAYYIIKISEDYTFNFSVKRSTRTAEELYTSTAIEGDNFYGVNKSGDDAVFVLRLSVNPAHLSASVDKTFNDIIGVEMVSNGGGMITNLFQVYLSDSNSVM